MKILDKIKLGYSPLTQKIYLFRHGKDENTALDKREAEKDVMAVLVDMMMDGTPEGAVKEFHFGDQWYQLTLIPFSPIDL